ncbi:hypothetical protein OIDMADRAFT_31323 [Oidiodendron maius Zn]|uniref:Mid2 domain-containing protein n=1 Tax=Oidiodendron maius (strain Zn) TaxID=913774 RepID=A0A0C3CHR7_OIDMZ|nr:hypothetical protein OIDMADRAFT_31323 [Oidiodendron maius Zn]
MYQLVSVLVFLSPRVVAQIVQNNWIAPVGTDPDFQQTFINGTVLAIAWEGWNSSIRTQYLEEATTTADLWVTSFNFALSAFSQLLSANINVAGPGSYSWTINIDAKSLSTSAEYVLRFTTPGKNYDNIYIGVPNIPSPGFVILPETTTSSSSSSASPTSTSSTQSPTTASKSSPSSGLTVTTTDSSKSSTSAIAASTSRTDLAPTSITATSVSSTDPAPNSIFTSTTKATTGLKPSAIAGTAAGSAIGSIAAAVLLVIVFRRYWRSTPPTSMHESKDEYALPVHPHTPPLTELPTILPEFATSSNISELPASYNTR